MPLKMKCCIRLQGGEVDVFVRNVRVLEFAAIGFLESELYRVYGKKIKLPEMNQVLIIPSFFHPNLATNKHGEFEQIAGGRAKACDAE